MDLSLMTIPAASALVLQKLCSKPLSELGEILADRVRLWRFSNQISILSRAKEIADSEGLEIKPMSLKVLLPLLDGGSLEEDPNIQDLWARLLVRGSQDEHAQRGASIAAEMLKALSPLDCQVFQQVHNMAFEHWEPILRVTPLWPLAKGMKQPPAFDLRMSSSPYSIVWIAQKFPNSQVEAISTALDNLARFQVVRLLQGQDEDGSQSIIFSHVAITRLGWQILRLLTGTDEEKWARALVGTGPNLPVKTLSDADN